MNASSLPRTNTVLVAVLVTALATSGCDFLGFDTGGEEPVTVTNDNSGENDDNDSDDTQDTTQTLVDDDFELVSNYTGPIEFDVPENAYSVSISILDGDHRANYMVTDWQAPNDYEIVPAEWEDSAEGQICYPGCNNRVMMSIGANGSVMPNNPDALPGVEPGSHEFRVHTAAARTGGMGLDDALEQSADTVRVVVHAEVADDAVPEEGTLDLNLFFSGANGWTADNAEDDAELQAIIDDVDEMYDQVGIDIGEVAYHDIEGNYRIIEDMNSGDGDLSQMFAQSERAELEGPSIFFIDELSSPFGGGGGGVLGISGGIPGPMLVDGTPRSGVAVATDSAQAPGSGGISKVTAHELGHYLGLFHTSEHFGGMGGTPAHDPLPDTEQDDEGYLMHASGTGEEMSEWQGRVMRNNPWVYQSD